jgi:hypothetical protein
MERGRVLMSTEIYIGETERECTNVGCDGLKPYTMFNKQKDGKNGRTSKCKSCLQEAQNIKRKKNMSLSYEVKNDKRSLDFDLACKFLKFGLNNGFNVIAKVAN